jgi:hypothetical protein
MFSAYPLFRWQNQCHLSSWASQMPVISLQLVSHKHFESLELSRPLEFHPDSRAGKFSLEERLSEHPNRILGYSITSFQLHMLQNVELYNGCKYLSGQMRFPSWRAGRRPDFGKQKISEQLVFRLRFDTGTYQIPSRYVLFDHAVRWDHPAPCCSHRDNGDSSIRLSTSLQLLQALAITSQFLYRIACTFTPIAVTAGYDGLQCKR